MSDVSRIGFRVVDSTGYLARVYPRQAQPDPSQSETLLRENLRAAVPATGSSTQAIGRPLVAHRSPALARVWQGSGWGGW